MRSLRRTHPRVGVQHKAEQVPAAINQLINITCSSGGIRSLVVRQQYRDQPMRPQLHLILQGAPGSLKSTILEEVGARHGVSPYSYITYAAMIGTIDSMSGDLVPGLVWQTRGKLLLLDEFKTGERGDTGSIDVLLGVLESGRYKRKVGQRTRIFNEEDGDLYCRVKDGEIEVKTRFPCIIATMKNLDKARSAKYPALIQRCIPIRFALSQEQLDGILQGKTFYDHHQYPVSQEVTISKLEYSRILQLAHELRSEIPDFQSVYARAVGDICRVTAVLGKVDPPLSRLICYLKAGYKINQALTQVEKKNEGSSNRHIGVVK